MSSVLDGEAIIESMPQEDLRPFIGGLENATQRFDE
jgi:hypothetical protein